MRAASAGRNNMDPSAGFFGLVLLFILLLAAGAGDLTAPRF